MATFNGQKYVEQQLFSILRQLSDRDEVIIVDDGSSDGTVAKISSIDDSRIRLVRHQNNQGHVKAFEHALSLASGELIFLSDQDDIWIENRIALMESRINKHKSDLLVSSFYNFEGSKENRHLQDVRTASLLFSCCNLVMLFLGRQRYFGCTMVMRRRLLQRALPFPREVEAHDRWIGILGNVLGGVEHLNAPTVLRRLHQGNLTPRTRRNFWLIVKSRYMFLRLVGIAFLRSVNWR